MFCAAVVAAGTCLFACSGTQAEFERAWQWPGSVQLDDGVELDVGEYGRIGRQGDVVTWITKADPATCAPTPASKPQNLGEH